MSAERLRESAQVLRERAEAATPGPWAYGEEWAAISSGPDSVIHAYYVGRCDACSDKIDDDAYVAISGDDAAYIATMHPGVGLALADWLELVSAWIDEGLGLVPPDINIGDAWADVEGQAHKVADLILGDAS